MRHSSPELLKGKGMGEPWDVAIAYHEAGHAAVACLLGAVVGDVVMSEGNRDEGLAHIKVKGLSQDAIRQILFAGSLAEIKYRAMAQWGYPVTFDLIRLSDLERVAYEKDCLEEHNPAIHFRTGGNQPAPFVPADGNVFSDFEDFCCSDLREKTKGDDFINSLRAVIQRLDDSDAWGYVKVVAEELLEKAAISGERLMELLRD